jgi:hypothetical protein
MIIQKNISKNQKFNLSWNVIYLKVWASVQLRLFDFEADLSTKSYLSIKTIDIKSKKIKIPIFLFDYFNAKKRFQLMRSNEDFLKS